MRYIHTYLRTYVLLMTERAVLGVADLFALMTEGYMKSIFIAY